MQVFFVGAVVSFVGSIPPGTLNLLVLQLGLENKFRAALRFALAVAIVEYPYAWIAVAFEGWVTSSPLVQDNFKLLSAAVMVILGGLGLWTARAPSSATVKLQQSGFVRGLILSLLNPQAIPWWIGMTAYLKAQGWIFLDTPFRLHAYVLGTSVGALVLLTLVAVGAQLLSRVMRHNRLISVLPSAILLGLGIAGFISLYFRGSH